MVGRVKQLFPSLLFERLSKRDCQNALEVIHYAAQADSSEDIKEVLIRFRKHFPLNRLLGGLARIGPQGQFHGFTNVVNVSYPDEWLYLYWKNGYAEIDPVFKAASQTSGTHVWKQVFEHANSKEEHEFIEAAKGFGLVDGVTTGSVDPACGFASFCSFAGGDGVDAEQYAQFVEYLGHHLHLALLRTARKNAPPTDKCINALSPREVTILNWMKNGKTNWEIAKILGVTERTVRFHVESIFGKLDVTSRSHAVATAMEHGLPSLVGLPSTM
jgi:DNA-binding CsgD family transcriptional regulator